MDFDLDDQQRTLRDEARRFLEREAPISYARAMMEDETGYAEGVHKQMADLGWMALDLPEEHGGLGLGFIAQAILLIEMGRVVLPGPYLSTVVLAGSAIALGGSPEQRASLLPRIADGSLFSSLAEHGHVELTDGALHGERRFVTDGHLAEPVVVIAHTGGDTAGLFLAEPTQRRSVEWMDATRHVSDMRFDGVPGERLGTSDRATVHAVLDRAAVALAAESLGAAERVLEVSVEYAKQREQFGRPIGSFQAVKHRLADMLVDVESLRNAVYYAAWAIERGAPDASLAASVAKAAAGDLAVRVCKGGIQVHGGIGFTWESDMHLFLKRCKADAVLFGDPTDHRERVARMLSARASS
jgi:alkylation response protein AidB-like acyl-CoA dehydrogenase